MTNEITIDDGCDYTSLIVWRMNAGARARSGAGFVMPPVPQQVVPPLCKKTVTRSSKPKPTKRRSTDTTPADVLVSVMFGKTLTYRGILAALAKLHPECSLTLRQLQMRVFSMIESRYVGITRHDDMPVTHYTLYSIDPRFYTLSAAQKR